MRDAAVTDAFVQTHTKRDTESEPSRGPRAPGDGDEPAMAMGTSIVTEVPQTGQVNGGGGREREETVLSP